MRFSISVWSTKAVAWATGSMLIHLIWIFTVEVEKNTVAGKAAKAKEKELEEWLRGLDGMDRLVDDYVGDRIPLWEKIMDRQGTVCYAWEKTAFEEGLKVGIRLMMEAYSL